MPDGIPENIKSGLGMTPAEDVILQILRDNLPGIPVQATIRNDQDFPFVLLRRDPTYGRWAGDPRFTDAARVSVQSFVSGVNGDQEAAELSHFIHLRLVDESRKRRMLPGLGNLISVQMTGDPRRASDWATATGPVQYSQLPQGVWRYEATYDVIVRRPPRPYYATPTP